MCVVVSVWGECCVVCCACQVSWVWLELWVCHVGDVASVKHGCTHSIYSTVYIYCGQHDIYCGQHVAHSICSPQYIARKSVLHSISPQYINVTHSIYPCYPQHILHSIYVAHSICTESIPPQYIIGLPTAYNPNERPRPQYIPAGVLCTVDAGLYTVGNIGIYCGVYTVDDIYCGMYTVDNNNCIYCG